MLRINELKVLLVDNNIENLMKIEALLKKLYITVLKAQSGEEALRYMISHEMFLVIMAVEMENMDGFQTAEMMRKDQNIKNIPIIFVTSANKERQYIFKGYQLGAVDYLFKPIDPVIITSKVKVFMDMYKKNYLLKVKTDLLERKLEELIQLRESNYELERLSFYDSLTGISNRRRFDEILDIEWKRALRERKEISLIMIDVDNFKCYNDNYGHTFGDESLRKVASAINYTVQRSSDLVARYGGEEFVALLPSTSNKGAIEIAEKIRKSIELLNIKHEYSDISDKLTVSLGVNSVVPNISKCKIEFIEQADRALYSAKSKNKNKVENAVQNL